MCIYILCNTLYLLASPADQAHTPYQHMLLSPEIVRTGAEAKEEFM